MRPPGPFASGAEPRDAPRWYASINLGVLVPTGAAYNSDHHWRTSAGELRASVASEVGGHSAAHVQGQPAALRELAAALVEAADQAETAHPTAEAAAS